MKLDFFRRLNMEISYWKDVQDVKIETFPYKGKKMEVKGTSIRWLSKFGDDGNGYPDYGLRFFTIQPGGEIPIHQHFYQQTMFIIDGRFECYSYDPASDELTDKIVCAPGTSIFIKSLEPHGMKNISNEPGTFLCCICNVYDQEHL
jgi:quercetin dioxygenase-like cupin family protein